MVGFLYGQTEYNILECSLRLLDYVTLASEYGYKALSITDRNLHAHFKFYTLCKEKGIKPLIGLQIKVKSNDAFSNSLICYAMNNEGYQALLKISTMDKLENKIFSVEELSCFKGLYFISTDESDIYRAAKQSQNELEKLIKYYESNLENFGVGISLSNPKEIHIATTLRDMAFEYGYRIFPLAQTLYNGKEDAEVYKALCLVGNISSKSGDYHYKDSGELIEEFFMFEEVFNNFEWLVENTNVEIKPVDISLPKFPKTEGKSSSEYLKEISEKGLKRRFGKAHYATYEEYVSRLNHELSVIHSMGYDDYFLIVWDFVLYAKKAGIMVGPGRGSAAGSLVSYCLGITNVDPLRYDLLFERFLNPERVSMPDIDMDFPDDKRDEVISYVKDLYGKDRVCNISTFGTFQVKSSIRDLGRVLQVKSSDLDIIVKLASTTTDYNKLLDDYKENKGVYRLMSIAKRIENLPRHISTHAAGIILSNDELIKNVPLGPGLNNLYQSQLESSDLAHLGLLKIDFLGLRNLNIIDQITKEIPGMNNISIQDIPLDDNKTFELLRNGDTLGVFQLESAGITKVLKELKPQSFEDIVAVLSLYRPGPMDNIPEFIARKNGKKFDYIHPKLEPILKTTYGIIVYQEQIMRIAYEFAGLSLGEADILRRAVSKKDKDSLDKYRLRFVTASKEKGYSDKVVNEIYDYIVKFASYGFNKSHSVAYALVSYQMAYFKANYFSVFMAKILNNVIGNTITIISYINYAKLRGVVVLKPDINESTIEFESKDNNLIYPLQGILGIGSVAAKEIVKERIKGKYLSFSDFKKRVKSVNQKMLESLIYAGAFDSFGHTKKSMLESSDEMSEVFKSIIPEEERIVKQEDEFDYEILKENELKVLGFNIEYDSFKNIELMQKKYSSVYFSRKYVGNSVKVIIELRNIKEIKTKKGTYMLVGNAYDGKSELSMVIFPKVYVEVSSKVKENGMYLATGIISFDETRQRYQYLINTLTKI